MTLKHLVNCTQCDWYEVVEGPSMLADVAREQHGDSIRNWRVDSEELCDLEAIAWVTVPETAKI